VDIPVFGSLHALKFRPAAPITGIRRAGDGLPYVEGGR
jgi:hypothetical protein